MTGFSKHLHHLKENLGSPKTVLEYASVIGLTFFAIYAQNLLLGGLTQLTTMSLYAGVSTGVLLSYGAKHVYSLFFSCALAVLISFDSITQSVMVFAVFYAFACTLQSAAICITFQQMSKKRSFLDSSHSFFTFFVVSACVCVLCSGLLTLNESAFLTHDHLSIVTALNYTLASLTGTFIIAPAILSWGENGASSLLHKPRIESALWLMLFIANAMYAKIEPQQSVILMIPLLAWPAARFSYPRFSVALALCAFVVLPIQSTQLSPPDSSLAAWVSENEPLLSWLLLLLASLYFNILVNEKRQTESRLEELVQERTFALSLTNQELKDEIYVREQAERSQRNASKRYKALIETAGIPIIVLDHNICIRQWNRAAENTFGYSREQIVGKNFIDHFIPEAQQDDMAWKLTRVFESGINQNNIESEVLSYEGITQIMLWNINQLPSISDHGNTAQFLLIGQNISDIRKTQDQLHYLAHFDSLTGCANRRLFEDRCAQAIQSAIRHKHNIALIGLDIDHFKRINDTLGHDAGDAILVELANRLKKCVRREDTIARLGGDEFAVLLANINGQDGAETVARNMLETITSPIHLTNNEMVVTSSIGITLCPIDGTHYPDLLKNADMAMYRAKKAGRNNIQFYSPEMNDEMQRQMLMEQELRVALKEKQFELYYQPIVDIETGEVVALEALLRWNHPHRGMLRPNYFLQTAEQTGLLNEIGEWALQQTCEQGLLIQSYSPSIIQLALNISTRQYNHPDLVKTVKRITHECGFDPKNLILEISESTINTVTDKSMSTLLQLSQMGLSLTIDGFGTGLSSLRQIKQIPIDIIKIDRSFVNGIPEDTNDIAIAETLLTIATHLDLKTFATGVETRKQEAFLKINGCRYAQGYLYSAPLPFAKLKTLFESLESGETLAAGKQIYLPFSNNNVH